MKAAALALGLAACDPAPVTMDQYPCPPAGTTLTYPSFGARFFADNCDRCHSATIGDRHGAPESYVFDSIDDIRDHAERIFVRAAATNTSMPPGPDDPPADARDDLAVWLACGAP